MSPADYVGLEVIDRSDLTICNDPPLNLDVCDLAVILDNAEDRLISIAFSNVSTTDPAGFYQHTLGGDTAPGCTLVSAFPTVACDSFITLGLECDTGATATDPDFDDTAFNSSGTVSGGWLNSNPPNSQGAPDANGRVMISRFSYKQNKTTSGDVCVFTKLAGSEEITSFLIEPFDCANPGMQENTGGDECPATGMIWYVDDTAPGLNTGLNWTNAFTDLQTALDSVVPGDHIWVAAGTYTPTKLIEPPKLRTEAFALADCLEIYGGFFGTPETEGDFNERDPDPSTNGTVLTGDLDGDDAPVPCTPNSSDCDNFGQLCVAESCITPANNGENSYHVVVAYDVDDTAILDGFTVSGGRADGSGQGPIYTSKNQGSGVNIYSIPSGAPSTPKLVNCQFRGNWSADHGAVNDHGGATLTDCVFRENHSVLRAGGLYVHSDIGTTVTSCEFYDNTTEINGGGAYVNAAESGPQPTFQQNCIFSGNQALHGGGMYCGSGRAPSLSNCTFIGNINTASLSQGGGMYNDSASPMVENCTFSGNGAHREGGAIYNNVCSFPTIRNCTFIDNFAINGSGVYNNKGSNGLFDNCTFTGHHTTVRSGYAGGIYNIGASPTIRNCDFVDGLARYGGGIYTSGSDGGADEGKEGPDPPACLQQYANMHVPAEPQIINCTFIDNEAGGAGISSGGGVFAEGIGSVSLTNCLFARNRETKDNDPPNENPGGAIGIFNPTKLYATNCTFVANTAVDVVGGVYMRSNELPHVLDNCIFWENSDSSGMGESAQILLDGGAAMTGYNDIMGLVQGGPFCELCGGPPPVCCNDTTPNGNIDADPVFVASLSGTWTAPAPTYDSTTDETTFTHTTAGFVPDALIGAVLNPNITQARVSIITANTADTVTALSDLRAIAGVDHDYQIEDYRLQSVVFPATGSPCIDAGDNNVVATCGLDLDGNERTVDDPATDPDTGNGVPPFVDMGAYEFGGPLAPDCNGNAMDDDCELDEELTPDCNFNIIPDDCDIASGTSEDTNADGIPDECECGTCPTDANADGETGAFDLATLLAAWGSVGTALCLDANADGEIGAFDLASLLAAWGPCP